MKFSRCDQMCYPCLYSRILAPGEVVWFHVYIVRLLAWALAVVPASVVYASARLSLFPVFVFSSLDPEHAIHVNFYRKNFLCVLFFYFGTPESSSDAILYSAKYGCPHVFVYLSTHAQFSLFYRPHIPVSARLSWLRQLFYAKLFLQKRPFNSQGRPQPRSWIHSEHKRTSNCGF